MPLFRRRSTQRVLALHDRLDELVCRVDELAASIGGLAPLDRVVGVQRDSAKVAAELGRLEINLAARLEAIRVELDELTGDGTVAIDLRVLSPADSGWPVRRSA